MLKVTVKESGNLKKKLDDLARRASELDGQHEVQLSELMPAHFISGCSAYGSLEQLLKASPFEINSIDDFKAIPDAEWDEFIDANTCFASWEEMRHAAAQKWMSEKLGFK